MVTHVRNLRLGHLGRCRPCVVQELVDLMRADVAQNTAVLLRMPEPLRPAAPATCITGFLHYLVRRDVDRLDHLADGARLHQVAGLHRRGYLQTFAVQNAVDAFGLGDGLADERKVLARFVGSLTIAKPFPHPAPRGATHMRVGDDRGGRQREGAFGDHGARHDHDDVRHLRAPDAGWAR